MATQQPNRSIAGRWTPTLAQKYTPIANAFIEHASRSKKGGLGLGLNPTQAMIIVQLMNYKRDDRMPFPGIRTLAARLGIASSTVRTNIDGIEAKGLLIKHLREGETTLYDLTPLFIRLEELQQLAAERKAEKKAKDEAARYPDHYPNHEVATT